MADLKIEVVTPVRSRKELTLFCPDNLERADLSGVQLRVIFVDDGSTDGTSEAPTERCQDVTVIRGDGNLWYTAGTKIGLAAAIERDPDFVPGINNDSEFDPNILQRHE